MSTPLIFIRMTHSQAYLGCTNMHQQEINMHKKINFKHWDWLILIQKPKRPTAWKVQIRSFFWSEYRKIRTKKTPYLDIFHAVSVSLKDYNYPSKMSHQTWNDYIKDVFSWNWFSTSPWLIVKVFLFKILTHETHVYIY